MIDELLNPWLQGIVDTRNLHRLKGRVNKYMEEKSTEVATSLCLQVQNDNS